MLDINEMKFDMAVTECLEVMADELALTTDVKGHTAVQIVLAYREFADFLKLKLFGTIGLGGSEAITLKKLVNNARQGKEV